MLLSSNCNVFESSEVQYGFQMEHPTIQCTFVLDETINYYTSGGSIVHVMLLDAGLKNHGCVHAITAHILANLYPSKKKQGEVEFASQQNLHS